MNVRRIPQKQVALVDRGSSLVSTTNAKTAYNGPNENAYYSQSANRIGANNIHAGNKLNNSNPQAMRNATSNLMGVPNQANNTELPASEYQTRRQIQSRQTRRVINENKSHLAGHPGDTRSSGTMGSRPVEKNEKPMFSLGKGPSWVQNHIKTQAEVVQSSANTQALA
jgi:hypothetical protein